MMADTYLNVVDGDDQIIGRQLRSIIHRDGLRHREVHVWLVTKKNELIFQKRGPHKDIYPNLLDASVGGHVEEGQDYMAAALAEVHEEAGLELMRGHLLPLKKVDVTQIDAARNVKNVVYRMVYLHRFAGDVASLRMEAVDGAGFVAVPLADVLAKRGESINQMVPGLFDEGYMPVWQAMRDVLRV